MATKIHGIESIEIGEVGEDGAAGTSLTEVTAIQLDSVTITIPAQEGEQIYVEETDSVYDELQSAEPDPVTIAFSTYNAENTVLNAIFGGTLDSGKYTPSRDGAIKTVVITSRARDGVKKRFTFPKMRLRPSSDASLTKSALTAMTGNGTALTPYDAENLPLQDWYMEDVLVPVGNPTSLVVTPATASIAEAATQQLTAIAHYSNGATLDVTALASYVSGTPATATVNSTGLITAVAAGTSTVTATYLAQTDDCALTVTA